MRRFRPARTPGAERGAAAVEFALVLTVLLPVLFGIVDYGIWWSDSLKVRHGVYEAARLAVVQRATCTTGSPTTDLAKITCAARERTGATYAYVKAPNGWLPREPLIVCVMLKGSPVTGITPLPGQGVIRGKAELAIEADKNPSGAIPTGTWTGAGDPPPTGMNWNWCT